MATTLSDAPSRVAVTRRFWLRLAGDALLLLVLYKIYSAIQGLVPARRSTAEAHAHALWHVERLLHLDPEHVLNSFVAAHPLLAQACNYYYTSLHFVAAVSVALWLLARHGRAGRQLLNSLYAATAIALLGFWLLPTAPPRLLTGGHYVDTVVKFHTWGGWSSGPVDELSNQFAAVPSLHMAWSLWCAIAVSRFARRPWVRAAVWLYPAATLFVILGTGNHYLLDAVAGALVLGLGFVAADGLLRAHGVLRPPPREA